MLLVYCRAYSGISLLSILSIHLYRAHAALVNRTIDNEHGDSVTGEKLEYFPSTASTWKQGRNCTDCIVQLDPSLTRNGTWHDATQHPNDPEVPSITAHFNGTAVYVYNVLASYSYGQNRSQRTVSYLTFELDGQAAGAFLYEGDGSARYDVPVYARQSLADGPHTLVIRVPPGITGNDWSVVLFDYIMYTHSTDPPTTHPNLTTTSSLITPSSSPSPSPTSPISPSSSSAVTSMSPLAIAGATLGSIGIVVVAVLTFLLARRRARASSTRYRGSTNELSRSSLGSSKGHYASRAMSVHWRPGFLPLARSKATSDALTSERALSSSDDHSHGFSEILELRQQMARIQELVKGQSMSFLPIARSKAASDALSSERALSSSDAHSHGFSEILELRQQMARIQELVKGQSVSEGEVGTGKGWR